MKRHDPQTLFRCSEPQKPLDFVVQFGPAKAGPYNFADATTN
jgi:hypothetical protein